MLEIQTIPWTILNQRYGRGIVLMASAGLAGDRRRWEDMVVARA